jgi:SNF2 family DNA or RNA helicase
LPEIVEQIVWIEMEEAQRQIYESFLQKQQQGLMQKIRIDGTSVHRMEILEAILRLRQICCHPALTGAEDTSIESSAKCIRLLEDLECVVEEKRKVLVYSQFTQMLKMVERHIRERGWNYVYLDGSTKDREAVVSQFQANPEVSIFLVSLKAGGVGLNLTAADYVFIFDPWWNDAVERQAINRAHRIGRKETVVAKRYITAYSVEEKMMKIKEKKSQLAEQLLEGSSEDASGWSLDDLASLLG